MGRVPTGERKYQIQELWDIHHEILRLLVIGWKPIDIAEHLGVTPTVVSYTRNSAIGRRHLGILEDSRDLEAVDVARRIQSLAPVAVDKLEEILKESENDNVVKGVAQDLLDRAGYPAVKVIRGEHLHAYLSQKDIEEIKGRAKEIGLCVTGTEPIDLLPVE